MGALSDKTVGEYVEANFVTCYEQVGDFRVTATTNGQLARNGGNVVSYFCTPELKVINAIVGPVEAAQLLGAAHWSVNLSAKAKHAGPDDRLQICEAAHLEESGIDPATFYQVVSEKLPRISRQYQSRRTGILASPRLKKRLEAGEITLIDPFTQARQEASRAFTLDRRGALTHRILAMQPLASVYDVYGELFERVAGERITTDRQQVDQATEALSASKPVLLVVYQPQGVDGRGSEPGRENQRLIDGLKQRAVVKNHFRVVALPNDQLAALSSQVDIPVYRLRVQPAVIVIKDGKQVANFTLYDSEAKVDRVLREHFR